MVELPVIVVVVWMGWISMPFAAVKEVFVTGQLMITTPLSYCSIINVTLNDKTEKRRQCLVRRNGIDERHRLFVRGCPWWESVGTSDAPRRATLCGVGPDRVVCQSRA